jgi:hypothetical protein
MSRKNEQVVTRKRKPKKPVWTARDRRLAHRQGWDIFQTEIRGLEIEALDAEGILADDSAALRLVFKNAAGKDKRLREHARKALEVCEHTNMFTVRVALVVNIMEPVHPDEFNRVMAEQIVRRLAETGPEEMAECWVIEEVEEVEE